MMHLILVTNNYYNMRYFLSIIFFFLFTSSPKAQINSNYQNGFKIGFQEGYCYNNKTVDCFTPITPLVPLPRLNEKNESYIDGYNRGFNYGLDLKKGNLELKNNDLKLNQNILSFNQYVPQNPAEAMRVVGMIKQKTYDSRKNWIQERITGLVNTINFLFDSGNFPINFDVETHRKTLHNEIVKYSKEIGYTDFADNYQFSRVQSHFNYLETYYYKYYNSIVSKIKPSINSDVQIDDLLRKKNGSYTCEVRIYKSNDIGYVLQETLSGNIKIDGKFVDFKSEKRKEWGGRELLKGKTDDVRKGYSFETSYGDVFINNDFTEIIFYDLGNTYCYQYIIIGK